MKPILSLVLAFIFSISIQAQKKPAYKLFKANGKKTSYKKMLKKAAKADIVLFGEHHNSAIAHWLQLELTKDASKKRKIAIGFEMIEADNQTQLDDYMNEKIDQKAFDTVARLWKNHKTDYKPIVDFAKKNKIKAIACNVPRRYASKIFRGGFESLDSLSVKEKTWIAPLPIAYDASLPGYVKMKAMMGGHGGDNLPKAQAIKDATMAHFILKNKKEDELFIHYNGSYHSDNYEGIYWYLKQANPDLNIVTITTTELETPVNKFDKENKNLADFIIQVPESMTKTY
ncbi:MAG: ChaN family lipoprotein [Flavobacteriaceae bacterium]